MKDINIIDSMHLEEDDRITAYLKGQMTKDEENQFLSDLEKNPELKEKAIVTARLVKGLKQVGAEQDKDFRGAFLASGKQGVEAVARKVTRDESQAISAEQEQPAAASARPIPLRRISSWVAIAASIIFVVRVGFVYNEYRVTTGLGKEYCNNIFSEQEFSRGASKGAESSSDTEKKLKQLFQDVKDNKNIDNAIHDLSLYWELSTMDIYNDYTDYSAEIGMNLAIAYLLDNDRNGALKVLTEMSSRYDSETAVGSQVRELQQKIKDL
jgi:hypothetical protein